MPRIIAFSCSLLLIACGGDSTSPDASPPPPEGGPPGNADSGMTGSCGEAFLDLSGAESPAEGLPAAMLSVECTDDEMIVTSNGLPHYRFRQTTPNALQVQNHEFRMPLNPSANAEPTDIPLLGTVGVAVNGAPFYGPNEAANLGWGDPIVDNMERDLLDDCLGHTGGSGDYHYHALPVECLSMGMVDETGPSPIIGYALDGFPIYGPRGCVDADCSEVVEFQSSWVTTGLSTEAWENNECTRETCAEASGTYLDRCNGRVGPDGTYRYHTTATFPYILGCFRGTADTARGGMMGGMDGPAACTEEADCVDACPPDSVGCTCHETPTRGARCVPTCTSDEDCPMGMGGARLICNPTQGICVPERRG